MALIVQVERQAGDITRVYDDGNGLGDSYAAFRDFTERLDQFHVFVGLVEGKLGDIAADKREAQEQSLAATRWRLMELEIAAMQSFMTRFLASGKPWPLGSQAFLNRREARLDEIIAFQRESPAPYHFAPPDDGQITSLRGQFNGQSGLSLPLDDFGAADFSQSLQSFDEPDAEVAPDQPEIETPATPVQELPAAELPAQEFPVPPAIAKPEGGVKAETVRPAAPARAPAGGGRSGLLKKKKRLAIRVEGENVYLDGESAGAVEDACKQAGISMDELAKRMGLGRSTLVLMLKGADAIERKPLNQLRVFVSQNGGLV